MATKKKNTVDHRKRKDGGSREHYSKLRKKRNEARPKQRWTGGDSVATGGHWERP